VIDIDTEDFQWRAKLGFKLEHGFGGSWSVIKTSRLPGLRMLVRIAFMPLTLRNLRKSLANLRSRSNTT